MEESGLDKLCISDEATVCGYTDDCDIKRRFMELGFVPGTKVKCVLISPMGDPKAFLIKNTVIAIRDEDSRNIKICR